MNHTNTDLIAAVRAELARAADPAKAPTMRAYMKSEMPYLGVPLPLVRTACRTVFADHPLDSFEEWRDTALSLWRAAQFLDRDTNPAFAGANGMQGFLQNFLGNPSQDLDKFLSGIQSFYDSLPPAS